MAYRVSWGHGPSSTQSERHHPEALQCLGSRIEALLSRNSSLQNYRHSLERQLAVLVARLGTQRVELVPRSVFLLLELRGSGGMSMPLEQIARILEELGYWQPGRPIRAYLRPDVYHLGLSAQQLFDDATALERRVRQIQAEVEWLREQKHLPPETTTHEVFADLEMTMDAAPVRAALDQIASLLDPPNWQGWVRWLFFKSQLKHVGIYSKPPV
jgi:hypothetical protein